MSSGVKDAKHEWTPGKTYCCSCGKFDCKQLAGFTGDWSDACKIQHEAHVAAQEPIAPPAKQHSAADHETDAEKLACLKGLCHTKMKFGADRLMTPRAAEPIAPEPPSGTEAMRARAIQIVQSWKRDDRQPSFTVAEVNQLLNDICGDLSIATVAALGGGKSE